MRISVIIWTLLLSFSDTECANILAIVPSPYLSHQMTYRPMWIALAKRGHNITLITTDPMEQNENITQIDLSFTYDIFNKFGMKEAMVKNFSMINIFNKLLESVDSIYEYQLTHPGVAKIMKNPDGFDLLMVEMVMPKWTSFSHKIKAPFIGMTSMEPSTYLHSLLGNAMHPAIYPMLEIDLSPPLSLKDRMLSAFAVLVYHIIGFSLQDLLFEKYNMDFFGKDCPTGWEMDAEASLVFMISNPLLSRPRPITPKTINLEGGLHIREPKELPKDLQTYLDQSKEGLIYFSLGTTVNSNALTPEVIEIFRNSFEKLAPIRVLWKFENETMPNQPKNVKIRKWLPQQDILRHPNVKLFITQGGLQSMEEALEFGVPLLGIPFFGDQLHNVRSIVNKKIGLSLELSSLNEMLLTDTIKELLDNPLYKNTMDKYSKIQRDRPMKALDKAVWWTEYVLRHGTTDHLRSPSADIPLYQYFFLDVLAVFILAIVLVVILCRFIIRLSIRFIKYLFGRIFRRKCKDEEKKEK